MAERRTATQWANYISENLFEHHRGAHFDDTDGVYILFGNDGYTQDDRSKEEVNFVRKNLSLFGATEVDFGLNDGVEDGYTWVMLIDIPTETDCYQLEALVDLGWARQLSPSHEAKAQEYFDRVMAIQKQA